MVCGRVEAVSNTAAGIIHVIFRDIWDHRRGRIKPEPTVSETKTPVSEVTPMTAPLDPNR